MYGDHKNHQSWCPYHCRSCQTLPSSTNAANVAIKLITSISDTHFASNPSCPNRVPFWIHSILHTHEHENEKLEAAVEMVATGLHLKKICPTHQHMHIYADRAASILLCAICRLLRPASDEVATASLSLLRSTSESDAERITSTWQGCPW